MSDSKIDIQAYLRRYPEVALLGIDPKDHFKLFGRRLGYEAIELESYSDSLNSLGSQQAMASATSRRYAWLSEKSNHLQCFDRDFYLSKNPDVVTAGVDPELHYFNNGWREGRDPNSWFSVSFYFQSYPEIKDAGAEPLGHFFEYGRFEGRYATFRDWFADRITRQVEPRVPSIWLPRDFSQVEGLETKKLAVHIHCFFIDVFEVLIDRLVKTVPENAVYFVSVVSEEGRAFVASRLEGLGLRVGRIAVVPNRGRDIAPLIVEFARDFLDFDFCLHLHTKKSSEKLELGARWMQNLMRTLIPSREFVENTIALMESDPSIGLIGPVAYTEIRPFMVWGQNLPIARELLVRTNLECSLQASGLLSFPAGSFFWFKPKALERLFDAGLALTEFPEEPISDDGTIAHAIERCLPIYAESEGFRYVEVQPVPYEAVFRPERKIDVSIVVPVYNAERYIHDLIRSIVSRDCFNFTFEIIAVDNNSNDSSYETLKKIAKIVPELKVLQERKQGAGAARNTGLGAAQGEFVVFVDADDMITPDAIGLLYDSLMVEHGKGEADFATSSLQTFGPHGLSVPVPYPDNGTYEILSKATLSEKWHLWRAAMNDFGSCAKMYRKSFLDLFHIKFPEGLNFEDNLFIAKVMTYSQKIIVLNQTTYLYRKQNIGGTQSTKICLSALRDQAMIVQMIIEDCNLQLGDSFRKEYLSIFVNKLVSEAERMEMVPDLIEIVKEMPILSAQLVQIESMGDLK